MTVAPCPGKETLLGYLMGKIPESDAEAVAAHLTTCAACEQTARALEEKSDTLVSALRHPKEEDAHAAEPEVQQVLERLRPACPEAANAELPKAAVPVATPPRRAMTLLGDYELLKKLGAGGMGTVYKARHVRLKRVVALKVLPKNRLASAEAVARFEREMEAVGRLDHPHIVRAMDAREVGGIHFLVMEYVDGLDVAEIVRRSGRLTIADACEIARQAALGLQCSDENGLVHRDIKPSNLMLTSAGEVKVLDLGLAQIQGIESHGGEITGGNQIMGTPDYMSPEQATESHAVDIRTDIYSLGCTLYHLLAGRPPFSGKEYDTPMKKVAAHIHKEAPPIQLVRADIPKPLAATLERMLAKDAAARLATPAAVIDALGPFCEGSKLIGLLREAQRKGPPAAQDDQPAVATGDFRASVEVETVPPSPRAGIPPVPPAPPEFDPYHRWLGIPAERQPANHYDLLGIPRFESDSEVIRDAAARQMAHVRTYQLGQHAELSQKILNELAAAKACLLNPEKKAAYDARLRQQLAAPAAPSPPPPVPPPAVVGVDRVAVPDERPDASTRILTETGTQPAHQWPKRLALGIVRSIRRVPPVAWLVAAPAGAVVLLGVLIYITTGKGTVKIEFSDPSAISKVELKIDGNQIEIAGLKDPLRLSVGDHRLEVASGQFKTFTKSFTVRRGCQDVVKVSLEPSDRSAEELAVAKPRPSPSQPAGKQPQPPLAVAPFGAATARKHQEAWAKYLGVSVEIANSIGMKLVLIPPGAFNMGSTPQEAARATEDGKKSNAPAWYFAEVSKREGPQIRVEISRPFCLGVYEVTQAEYQQVMGANPSGFSARGPIEKDRAKVAGHDTSRYPVENVTWVEATEFCRRLSALAPESAAGRLYRLPTEAEWEYACRAGTTSRWSCGDEVAGLLEHAWIDQNAGGMTHPVGQKKPNAWGLYDMHGNVWEWCADWAEFPYTNSPRVDPTGPLTGDRAVMRGGAYCSPSHWTRSAYRNSVRRWTRHDELGFRVAVTLAPHSEPRSAVDRREPKPPAGAPKSEPPAAKTAESGKWLDLLAGTNPLRAWHVGDWKRVGGSLVTETGGRIMLPPAVEGSYDLEVEFTRTEGDDGVCVVFPVGSSACDLILNGWHDEASGLEFINLQRADTNATKTAPAPIVNGQKYLVAIRVRTDRDAAQIEVDFDGRPYLRWSGSQSLLFPRAGVPDMRRIGPGAFQGTIFYAARLRLVAGKPGDVAAAAARCGGHEALAPPIANVILVKATFGWGGSQEDMTWLSRWALQRDPFAPIERDPRFVRDPLVGKIKHLTVTYRLGTENKTVHSGEDNVVPIPQPPREGVVVPGASNPFKILAARKGWGLTWMDVTADFRSLVTDPAKPFDSRACKASCDAFSCGRSWRDHLWIAVWFDYQGKRFVRVFREGQEKCVLLP